VTKQGKTPAKEAVPTGSYTIAFKRDGWPDQTQAVAVTAGATLPVGAKFPPGTLVVTSDPAGASVYANAAELGRTPWKTEQAPGELSYELRLNGFRSATVSGTIRAGEETTVGATLESEAAPKPGQACTIPDLGLELVPVEAGTFTMGSPDDETDRDEDEGPQTKITLSRAFWLGKNEVTQGQWQAIMGTTVAQQRDKSDKSVELHGDGPGFPMYYVSWNEAEEFCRKLTERESAAHRLPAGFAYTLPTEAQWEYACRAGTTGGFAGTVDDLAWHDSNSGGAAHEAGTKQSNPWGLNDLHGNVWEWCLDWKAEYPGESATDYAGPTSGEIRVFRGGSRQTAPPSCRSAYRNGSAPDYRNVDLGFRVALAPVAK
jgi:formylglycine-generating enzyme required for sulfatase activity